MTNSKGFSLIGLMVSLAVMSIIALGTAQLIHVQQLSQNFVEVKQSLNLLTQVLSEDITNEEVCSTILQNQNIEGDLSLGTFKANNIVPHYSLRILSIKIQPTKINDTTYYGTILLTAESTKDVVGPKVFAPRAIGSMYFQTKGTSIESCSKSRPATPANPKKDKEDEDDEFKRVCGRLGGKSHGKGCRFEDKKKGKDH